MTCTVRFTKAAGVRGNVRIRLMRRNRVYAAGRGVARDDKAVVRMYTHRSARGSYRVSVALDGRAVSTTRLVMG